MEVAPILPPVSLMYGCNYLDKWEYFSANMFMEVRKIFSGKEIYLPR